MKKATTKRVVKAKADVGGALKDGDSGPPPLDPAMGDKTPEYMRWLRANRPEEFVRRYKDRIVPEI